MTVLAPLELAEKDKLQVLQRLDKFRTWRSLDEKRYCLACGKVISGEQIQVIGDIRGNEPLRVICPTNGCHSIPMDWVRPTEEVLIKIAMVEAERRRNCLIIRAGRATRSLPKKNDSQYDQQNGA